MADTRPHILVTGASGFLGRTLVAEALASGARVTALVRPGKAAFAVIPAAARVRMIDHLDPDALSALLRETRPDLVIDAAGRIRVEPGQEAGFTLNSALVQSWVAGFQSARSDARLVTVGSAAQYGSATPTHRATRETDPYAPVSAYGASKVAATRAALAGFQEHGVNVRVGLVFNIIGPRPPEHLVPMTFIKRALCAAGKPVLIRGNSAIRDFIDVRDVARALIALGWEGRAGEVYNIGSGQPTRIGDLLDRITTDIGALTGTEPVWQEQPGPQGIPVSYADIDKIREATGWQPTRSLEASLADVIAATSAALELRK